MADSITVKYNIEEDTFEITGSLKPRPIIEAWIRSQIGKGEDRRPAEERDVYTITIEWEPQGDIFTARDDTGNKGLRDGILMHVLNQLKDDE